MVCAADPLVVLDVFKFSTGSGLSVRWHETDGVNPEVSSACPDDTRDPEAYFNIGLDWSR